jgi:hypothetical protein
LGTTAKEIPIEKKGLNQRTKADTPPPQKSSQEKPCPLTTGVKTKGATFRDAKPRERGEVNIESALARLNTERL